MKRTLIVGEAWGADEAEQEKPFVGSSGRILRTMLREVGIDPEQCYLTNVFNEHPPGNMIEYFCGPLTTRTKGKPPMLKSVNKLRFSRLRIPSGKYVRAEFTHHLVRLEAEIREYNPEVVIALGNTPLWALANTTGVMKYRGSPMRTWHGFPMICTWHPTAVMRQWSLRTQALMDFIKSQTDFTPTERKVMIPETVRDLYTFQKKHLQDRTNRLGCDIETANGLITEISFAPRPDLVLVVPFQVQEGSYWQTLGDEILVWKWVKHVCENYPIVGQGFWYDMEYIWEIGIKVNLAGDTMAQHHAMQPEMPRSLAFLASLYTNTPVWKHLRKITDDKE